MKTATLETQAPDEPLDAVIRSVDTRLRQLMDAVDPPCRPDGHPFRARGQIVSPGEYERRTGIPRVAAALALSLLGYTQADIAKRVGVNRRTLQVGKEFETFRKGIVSIRQQSQIAERIGEEM